jgi:uncharacterized protein HemX
VKQITARLAELERALTEANRQLLERDSETIEILAVRDRELAEAQALIDRLNRELARHARDIESLNGAIAEMQGTRAWQLAERYRRLRDLALRPLRRGQG